MAGSRLGAELYHEKSWTTSPTSPSSPLSMSAISFQRMPSSQSGTNQRSTSGTAQNHSISAPPPPSLAPLARALSIFYVLRCILGPLVESALLEDRVQWVQEQLVACKPDLPAAEGREREVTLTNVEMGYDASLVPLFSQLGEAGSARNVAVVVTLVTLSVKQWVVVAGKAEKRRPNKGRVTNSGFSGMMVICNVDF
ncbi:hypothetical protein F5051DRAFT_432394 [Lentinula edodes]|nr:hypothetical protein F5051DRAFT_432394 [Lentinula edodes]